MPYMKISRSREVLCSSGGCSLALVLLMMTLICSPSINADNPTVRVYEARNVTDGNRLFGEPVEDSGSVVGTHRCSGFYGPSSNNLFRRIIVVSLCLAWPTATTKFTVTH